MHIATLGDIGLIPFINHNLLAVSVHKYIYGSFIVSKGTLYHKVASYNTSCLEAHAGFFRLLMKGIFDPYVLRPFDKKLIS